MYLDNPCAVRGSAAEPEAPREAPHEAPPREAPCEVPCDGVRPCVRLQGSKVPCAVSIYYRVSPKDFTNVSVTNARGGSQTCAGVTNAPGGSQTRPGGRKRAGGPKRARGVPPECSFAPEPSTETIKITHFATIKAFHPAPIVHAPTLEPTTGHQHRVTHRVAGNVGGAEGGGANQHESVHLHQEHHKTHHQNHQGHPCRHHQIIPHPLCVHPHRVTDSPPGRSSKGSHTGSHTM